MSDYLRDKVGSDVKQRTAIVDSLFGSSGTATADDSVIFDFHMDQTKMIATETAPGFAAHLDHLIAPLLWENYQTDKVPGFPALQMWTNNNYKSLNHVLKMAIDWQP